MKFKPVLLIVLSIGFTYVRGQYPADVKAALAQTKTNQTQLTRALNYFYNTGDSLKIKSVNFLVANMPIHSSQSYYWADSTGQRIAFNELDYSTYTDAINAFEQLKLQYGNLHPVAYAYRDIDSITADMLIENVELAIQKAKEAGSRLNAADSDFFEYILPYRVSVEPLQNWRSKYAGRFMHVIDPTQPVDTQLLRLGEDIKKWFINTYDIQSRKEPLPRLGALQLLNRKKGACEDVAGLAAFMLRSQGMVGACDMVTWWATSSGKHFCNGTYNAKGEPIRFDAATSTVRLQQFAREPAKVIRTTYSNRKETIGNLLPQEQIPQGFMRTKNYIDVTHLYWPVDAFTVTPFVTAADASVLYACVFNNGHWQATWWAKNAREHTTFNNMSKGVVYLPVTYSEHKITAAGWPVALGYNNRAILQTDIIHTIQLVIPEKENYLKYRPQKKYTLYYWKNKWVKHSVQTTAGSTKQLVFNNVPSNALYLLLPEYSQHKDRPFICDKGMLYYF
jgi:hypothetical protein